MRLSLWLILVPKRVVPTRVNRSFKDRDLRTLTIRCAVLYEEPGRSSEVRHLKGDAVNRQFQTCFIILCVHGLECLRLERSFDAGLGF